MSVEELLTWLKKLIEEIAPAIAVMFWNYEETKVDQAKHEAMDATVNLELEKNHESVDQKYAGKPDVDILNDAIIGGGGQPGASDQSSGTDSSTTGDKLGQKK